MTIVTTVVVTYNRKALLEKCLEALTSQTRKPDRILIVDNASTDGTPEILRANGWLKRDDLELLEMQTNTGGAGGFAYGLNHAISSGADWVWMMDDDALPRHDALECLLDRELDTRNIYASVAVCGEKLSWPMAPENRLDKVVFLADQVPEELPAELAPFIGILIGKETVGKIGLPDADFFLVADDVEYSFRARKQGAKVVLVGKSRVEHPSSEWYSIQLGYRQLDVLKLAPWKRYYEVRNRLLIHKYYYRPHLSFANYAGWLLRLIATLRHEKERAKQIRAYIGGLIDGIMERKGNRHVDWGI